MTGRSSQNPRLPGNAIWYVTPLTVLLFAMGGYTASGAVGLVVGGVAGAFWSVVLALVVRFVDRTWRLRSISPTSSLILAGACWSSLWGWGRSSTRSW